MSHGSIRCIAIPPELVFIHSTEADDQLLKKTLDLWYTRVFRGRTSLSRINESTIFFDSRTRPSDRDFGGLPLLAGLGAAQAPDGSSARSGSWPGLQHTVSHRAKTGGSHLEVS
jgi:hypothetical protein